VSKFEVIPDPRYGKQPARPIEEVLEEISDRKVGWQIQLDLTPPEYEQVVSDPFGSAAALQHAFANGVFFAEAEYATVLDNPHNEVQQVTPFGASPVVEDVSQGDGFHIDLERGQSFEVMAVLHHMMVAGLPDEAHLSQQSMFEAWGK